MPALRLWLYVLTSPDWQSQDLLQDPEAPLQMPCQSDLRVREALIYHQVRHRGHVEKLNY